MTTLLLVRHGETDWNAQRRIQGSTDVPLNDVGRAQARGLAERLAAQFVGIRPLVVSSDLSRARETAEILARTLHADAPKTYRHLRERGYGVAEGMTDAEYLRQYRVWNRDDVPDAESRPHLRRRAVAGICAIVRDARRRSAPHDVPIIAVTHGALIGEVIRHASGETLPLPGERLANVSTHTFLIERDRLTLRDYAAVPVG
ncbi:MAG: histidine phosphatase family protein [Microbacterium sp.]